MTSRSRRRTGRTSCSASTRVAYASRYALMRDVALNLFWAGRFALTMYEKRPMRWADVPRTAHGRLHADHHPVGRRRREDRRRPRRRTTRCRRRGTPQVEDRIFAILFDVFGHRTAARDRAAGDQTHHRRDPVRSRPIWSSASPVTTRTSRSSTTTRSSTATRMCRSSRRCTGGRWCCTTSTRGTVDGTELVEVGRLHADDHVVVLVPRSDQVRSFLRRLRAPDRDVPRPRSGRSPPPAGPVVSAGERAYPLHRHAADRGDLGRCTARSPAPTRT